MAGAHAHHLDLHLHLGDGVARLEGTGRPEPPRDAFEPAPLLVEALGWDAIVRRALEGPSGEAPTLLRELSSRVSSIGAKLGHALGKVGRELGAYSHLPYVRLWVHAQGDACALPWEALVVPLSRDGALAFARVGELRGWQVLRARGPAALRTARSPPQLAHLVLIVGDASSPDATSSTQGEGRERHSEVLEMVRSIRALVPEGVKLHLRIGRAAWEPNASAWESLGASAFTGSHDLGLRALEGPTAALLLGHTCNDFPVGQRDGEARPVLQEKGPTSLLLDRTAGDLAHRSLPVVAAAAQGRLTLAQLLPPDTRLVLFLGCRSGDLFAPELPEVEHVVGLRSYVPFELTRILARELLQALCRPGSASVGESVRTARRALASLGPLADPSGSIAPLWWVPAHWPAVRDDEPFLDPASVLLADYRERLRAHVEGLEGDMSLHRRGLAQVAIPLEVTRKQRAARSPSELDFAEREARPGGSTLLDLVCDPEVRASAAPRARAGTWVLHGPPGSGKSTSVRDLARQLGDGSLGLIPLYVSLAEWRRHGAARDLEQLVHFLVTQLGLADRRPGRKEQLCTDLQAALCEREERLVVLLDGLDECGEQRNEAVTLLTNLRTSLRRAAIVVTTRPADYRPVEQYEDAWLQPLSPDQMQELLQRWYLEELDADQAEERAAADLRTIQAKEHALRELAQIPLFLNLMGTRLRRSGRLEATRRHEFLQDMLSWILEGKHRLNSTPFRHSSEDDTQSARRILAAIARELSTRRTTRIGRTELKTWLTHEAPQHVRGAPPFGTSAFLEAARKNGLFRPVSSDPREVEGDWAFWHRAFQECLSAESLHEEYLAGGRDLELLVRHARALCASEEDSSSDSGEEGSGTSPLEHWREPFALLAGFLQKAGSAWIAALLKDEATRDVALAAVATAESLGDDVLLEVLAQQKSEEEAELVYGHLGARLGRGPSVVNLLRERGFELARRMREEEYEPDVRIELWFLLDCLDAIHGRDPHVGASRAIDAVLDQIGPPEDVALEREFRWVRGRAGEPLWAEVRGGTFLIGSTAQEEGRFDSEDQVKVTLCNPDAEREDAPCFWIARTVVTLGQYRLFDRRKQPRWGEDALLPVTGVTWYEAALFCRWLEHHGGKLKEQAGAPADWSFQLPKEAQWEYACRDAPGLPEGGAAGYPRFVSGDGEEDLKRVGWNGENSGRKVHPVATAPEASPKLGLWDMHGNVWEWCQDWYAARLRAGRNPGGPPAGTARVRRGGAYWGGARYCRAASRVGGHPADGVGVGSVGFRVVLAPRPRRR